MDALQPRRDHLVKVQCALRWPLGWQVGFMRQKRAAASSRCCRPIFFARKKGRKGKEGVVHGCIENHLAT